MTPSSKTTTKTPASQTSAPQSSASATQLEERVVMPSVSADEALAAWQAYQELKARIIDPQQDIQVIHGQEFKKKSYWRKVATFFNLSIETKGEWKEQLGRTIVWHFTVRATAPNGRFVDGVGSCDVFEKATLRDGTYQTFNSYKGKWEDAIPNSPHNVRSTAYTRAFNRAVSDLIAGGEVSAEEMQGVHEAYQQEQRHKVQSARPMNLNHESESPRSQGQFKCEKCDELIPVNAMLKSKERYDDHTFCFKHQLAYKKEQISQAKDRKVRQPAPLSA